MIKIFFIKLYGWFYHFSFLHSDYIINKQEKKAIKYDYNMILNRGKDIGELKMLSAYTMGAYFISLNRNTELTPDDAYNYFISGLCSSKLFHIALGKGDAYLDKKNMPKRKKWSKISHEHKYNNDWVVDILEGNDDYDLGYNYFECGICKLCKNENCFELAKYLCQLDYVMADIMGMTLIRTMTIAEGGAYCDFRYSKK